MTLSALPPFSPLGRILADLDRCLEVGLYYPALLVALTIPEICAALQLPTKEHVKKAHYVPFVDKYAVHDDLGLTGEMCYQLRGGIVHRASATGHSGVTVDCVAFTLPGSPIQVHAINLMVPGKTSIFFDLSIFCAAMKAAALAWYEDYKDDEAVNRNMANLIRYEPDGIKPFVAGVPILGSG